MLDPKKAADFDQARAELIECIPPLLFSFYERLKKEGFSDTNAMALTRDYLTAMIQRGKEKT